MRINDLSEDIILLYLITTQQIFNKTEDGISVNLNLVVDKESLQQQIVQLNNEKETFLVDVEKNKNQIETIDNKIEIISDILYRLR